MKHQDGQSLTIEGMARPSVRQTSGPELTPLHWLHVIYDHSEDETDREDDLDAAPPSMWPPSPHSARVAE